MSDQLEKINEHLEAVALEVVTLEPKDIKAIGNLIQHFDQLNLLFEKVDEPVIMNLSRSMTAYLERMALREEDESAPLEKSLGTLQELLQDLKNGQRIEADITPLLMDLQERESLESRDQQGPSKKDDLEAGPEKFVDDDDNEILKDFVLESLDNLAQIEVSLIDLEQDPTDMEIINSIFRPFHTIKGVSGFLNLKPINRLAHSSENLLDKARNGDLRIDGTVIDLILESIDTLRKMIKGIQNALENNTPIGQDQQDVGSLLQRIAETISRAEDLGTKPVGEILLQKGAITRDDLDQGLETQKRGTKKKIGEILIEEKKVEAKEVISALRDQHSGNRQPVDLQVKVDTRKLDNLVDLTGELVIAQAILRQSEDVLTSNDQKLYRTINQLNQISSGLQKTAMSLRMVPIRNTFQKMMRLVRDLSRNFNKEVSLEMAGEDTEIDRNVVEELYEPMVHMIRNAMDHGIEPPEVRQASGKNQRGRIVLKAYHKGGHIIIEIEDDGRGLDRDRILTQARMKKIIEEEAELSDSEIFNLIFRPGFSTASEVTDVSGRGVGMDVVKKAIERLRGRVEIQSQSGRGSTFVISLPLTLAIIEGMLVRLGQERYIIPALSIIEAFRPTPQQCFTVEGKGEMVMSRNKLIPLIRLNSVLGLNGDSMAPWEALVVSVEYDGQQRCLLFDDLLGKQEVVIKSLGQGLKDVRGVAGGAIMGDGRVGLILDIAGIFDLAANS